MSVSLAPRSQAPSAQPKIGHHIGGQLIEWANSRVKTVFRPATVAISTAPWASASTPD